ncbi:hypothetical protein C8J57DRAFT_1220484 [Mycena rebaudengoi]|nr:hypothetical protein C8J57DRAFT_1220484 [Mycena rebaudengoi]
MPETMDTTYGAMLIGVLFATFFQGVLTLQAYIYFESFPNDPIKLKTLVATVWVLDVAHLVLISQSCYYYLISSWGNDAALLFSTKPLDLHLVFVGLATGLIWTFSKKNWLLTGLGCKYSLVSEDVKLQAIMRTPTMDRCFHAFNRDLELITPVEQLDAPREYSDAGYHRHEGQDPNDIPSVPLKRTKHCSQCPKSQRLFSDKSLAEHKKQNNPCADGFKHQN